jgi:flagellar protein FlgJ
MLDKLAPETRVYTEVQSLEKLRTMQNNDPAAAKHEVAEQFEAILMQMVLRSMRDANKALMSDDNLFGGGQEMDMYQDIYDKQLTLMLSHNSTGFASMIEKNLADREAGMHSSESNKPIISHTQAPPIKHTPVPSTATELTSATPNLITTKAIQTNKESSHFESPENFIKKLWPLAKSAAAMIGANPGVLLAQAALETNWGKKIIQHQNAESTHNLFNIKAGTQWNKDAATATTLEQKDGVIRKEKAQFRSYSSFKESFDDYVSLLKDNDRYSQAVSKAQNPHEFIQALQHAGYATDENYTDKVMSIYTSHSFKDLISEME